MRTTIAILLAVTLVAAPTGAAPASRVVQGDAVMYVGGTLAGVKPGTIGKLDLTKDRWVAFESGDARIEIPYKEISAFHYAQRLARRLGVIGTVAVVMVKRRQRRHFVEISYNGNEGVPQVALFEVSKDAAMAVVAVLDARSPRPCREGGKYQPPAPRNSSEATITACRVQTPPIYIPE